MNNDVFTLDDNNNAAIRTIGVNGIAESNSPSVFTTDENGNACVRVTGTGGGGGSDPHNLGWYADLAALQAAHATGEDGDFAILGSTDTIWVWDSHGSEWLDTTRRGQVSSVNGKTGDVVIPAIVAISGTSVTQQLATETIYNCGELTALSITFPASPTVSYISQLNFSSGATPTALTAPVGMVWVGDDITNDVFVPVANKRYCVLCFYDGTAMRGIVQAN